MSGGKSAETHIICQLCFGVPGNGILAFESKIFPKGQGINAEGHIAPGQIGRYFRGHHTGVGAGNIQIHIEIRGQGINNLLPALDFLYLIEEQIGFPRGHKLHLQLSIHFLGRHPIIFHGIVTTADNTFLRNIPLRFQPLHNHFKNRRFPAAANAGKNLYKGCIDISHNFFHIQRPVNHKKHLLSWIAYRKTSPVSIVLRFQNAKL